MFLKGTLLDSIYDAFRVVCNKIIARVLFGVRNSTLWCSHKTIVDLDSAQPV